MKKSLQILVGLLFVGLPLKNFAQFGYYNDALMYSRTNFGGTARMQGIGGAQVALGGDLSLANSNPAGLGFFNRSVFTVTPGLDFHSSTSSYFGERGTSFGVNSNFAQLGFAFNDGKGDVTTDKFKGGTFAITVNRTNNFNGEFTYDARNPSNSIVDNFIFRAGALFPNQLPGMVFTAYDHFLIDEANLNDPDDFIIDGNRIIPNVPGGIVNGYSSLFGSYYESLPRQSEVYRTTGGQYAINLAWGGNYDDKIYFGGGLGILTSNYSLRRTYIENDFRLANGAADDILNFIDIRDQLNVTGRGVNTNLGVIVRPIDFFTVGLTYQSPSFYAFEEDFEYTFETNWNSFYSYATPDGDVQLGGIRTVSDIFRSKYNLRTPSRVNLGSALFLGKMGFITADIEFVDYSTALLKSNDFGVTEDNDEILARYTNVINFRTGAEFRLEGFRFRGGYAIDGDPFVDSDGERKITTITVGAGYRKKDFFVDFALVNRNMTQFYSPYFLPNNQPQATVDMTTNSAILTLGFTF